MITALLPIFFAVLLLGLPILLPLALAVFLAIEFFGATNPVIVPMRMFTGMNNFSLMAIPFFILAAELMRIGGLSDRLINLAKALVGWVPGLGSGYGAVMSLLRGHFRFKPCHGGGDWLDHVPGTGRGWLR
ncbi:hypothetical protein HSBAA_60180 [Vreelandella sulfidaeris]|uniref:TRAP C4-dicarboxylate transport system permease DctM subunit domain-containing protein n=1 Tax=Vreelandella sulfidaeris TaxID=115553 RepID=A0A455UEJ2_9GAMM|nr:hypothetical protein HSBAA_60180 [Halomonas sulfidaeris]